MKLTIGMPSYKNYEEVWFTVQSLKLYQDLEDCEILIIDNYGDKNLENFVKNWANSNVRLIVYKESTGTAAAKNKVFEEANGEWVLCIDSHVLLVPDSIKKLKEYIRQNPNCKDLLQGPLLYDDLKSSSDSFNTTWSGGMWGQWSNFRSDRSVEPYEIPMMGMGLFCCRKDSWLGFNKSFKGFGGEEGYIHEKYRKYGYKTICLPWLQWNHYFSPASKPYNPTLEDKARNYIIGFKELGLNMEPLIKEFGLTLVNRYNR